MKMYLILVVLGLVGSFISYEEKQTKNMKMFFLRLLDGVFAGYIVFEIAFYYLQCERISFALCAVGAWMGTEAVASIGKELVKFLTKKKV